MSKPDSLPSHLFTVRIWAEELGDGHYEWRGQLQHVLSGRTRYIREWSALPALMLALVPPTLDQASTQ